MAEKDKREELLAEIERVLHESIAKSGPEIQELERKKQDLQRRIAALEEDLDAE
jgi:membrane protease subunit (stomatin/prohibitin family)